MSVISSVRARIPGLGTRTVAETAAPVTSEIAPRAPVTDLSSMLESSVARAPESALFGKLGASGEPEWMSRADFGQMVDRARSGLQQLGVKKGDRVALLAGNSTEWAATLFAAYSHGAVAVPIFSKESPERAAFILKNSDAKVVFADTAAQKAMVESVKDQLPSLKKVITYEGSGPGTFENLLERGARKQISAAQLNPDKDLATIVYTSGTTGDPKGVAHTHGNVAATVNGVLDRVAIHPDDVSFNVLPGFHIAGLIGDYFAPIAAGSSVFIHQGKPAEIPHVAGLVKPTVLFGVPKIWNTIRDGVQAKLDAPLPPIQKLMDTSANLHSKEDAGEHLKLGQRAAMKFGESRVLARTSKNTSARINKLVDHAVVANIKLRNGEKLTLGDRLAQRAADKLVFAKLRHSLGDNVRMGASGAAALSEETADWMHAAGIPIVQGYGSTEGGFLMMKTPEDAAGTLGKPLPGVEASVDFSHPSAEPEKNIGELVFKAKQADTFYWGNPAATAEVHDTDGTFHSGDLVRKGADGELEFVARAGDVEKDVNGNYIDCAAIGDAISAHPEIANAVGYSLNRAAPSTLVVPDATRAAAWAQAHGLTSSELADVVQNSDFQAHIAQVVAEQSQQLQKNFRPTRVVVSGTPFTEENGLLTNGGLKVKRRAVVQQNEAAFNAAYEQPANVPTST